MLKSLQIVGIIGLGVFASLDSDDITNIALIGLGLICSIALIGLTLKFERSKNEQV